MNVRIKMKLLLCARVLLACVASAVLLFDEWIIHFTFAIIGLYALLEYIDNFPASNNNKNKEGIAQNLFAILVFSTIIAALTLGEGFSRHVARPLPAFLFWVVLTGASILRYQKARTSKEDETKNQ